MLSVTPILAMCLRGSHLSNMNVISNLTFDNNKKYKNAERGKLAHTTLVTYVTNPGRVKVYWYKPLLMYKRVVSEDVSFDHLTICRWQTWEKHLRWRHDVETLSALLTLNNVNPLATMNYPYRQPVMWRFDVCFGVSQAKLFKTVDTHVILP